MSSIDPTSLLERFGLSDFRPGQRDVVDAIGAGQDVLCVMPTGGGKSLCYQLPSLARDGTTIVVSPLIALMKDQVDSLHELGIRAKLINSTLSASEQSDVMAEMSRGELDLVYVAPERLRHGRFLEAIGNANVTLLAVDEAHCVSEWGHDFRPDYSRLGLFRERHLRGVQTVALTATATPAVRDDICKMLCMAEPKVFVTGFARTNLKFNVSHSKTDKEKDRQLTSYLKQQDGAGIIYGATRKRCEELASWLPEKTRRSIGIYHGGMDAADRRQVQEQFMSGKLSAIVATNAFGMGIDKADIRFVVHYNMPGSLEAYYQEAGRAGRDGKESECLLMFSYQDRYVQEFFIENRYPSRETVRKVYEFLHSRPEDPIELTLDQVRDAIKTSDGSESIGTSQTLLARSGVLKRLSSNSNHAIVRIDSDAPTMLDFLPREAKIRRKIMLAIENIVGTRRYDDVFVTPQRIMDIAGVSREQLTRTVRELNRMKFFDYVPPFRGRAVHFTERDVPFENLDIDFSDLDKRKAAEYQKLEAVIDFSRTSGCRQRLILDYFGDPKAANCGMCDRCSPASGAASIKTGDAVSLGGPIEGVNAESLLCGIRVVLSGITRMHGRFGKNMIAQMLCGSRSKKLQQWKLHRLSTYGMLSELKQSEVAAVIDALVEGGLAKQREVDERRPTIEMSEDGKKVMHAIDPLPPSVHLSFPLAKRLAIAARHIEAGDVRQAKPDEDNDGTASSDESENAQSEATEEMVERLKRWRRKTSAAQAIPAYRVLSNATVVRVAEMMPKNSEQLEAVPGVGPATMEQFGYDILQIINGDDSSSSATSESADEYQGVSADEETVVQEQLENDDDELNEEDEEEDESEAQEIIRADLPEEQPITQQPFYWTWKLFQDEYTAQEIIHIRGMDAQSLSDDLKAAAKSGLSVPDQWIQELESMRKTEKTPHS